jgi:ferredoxin-type protein NapG
LHDRHLLRRDFLKSGFVAVGGLALLVGAGEVTAKAHVRPPGILKESYFLADCNRCGRCLDACPTQGLTTVSLLDLMGTGTPQLSGYCRVFNELSMPPAPGELANLVSSGTQLTPCMKCVAACPTGALKYVDITAARMGLASLRKETCLAWLSGTCNRCFDVCPVSAIDEAVAYHPVVNTSKCIGCAQCNNVCPTSPKSIWVDPSEVK